MDGYNPVLYNFFRVRGEQTMYSFEEDFSLTRS
jgi:hypothetical protein